MTTSLWIVTEGSICEKRPRPARLGLQVANSETWISIFNFNLLGVSTKKGRACIVPVQSTHWDLDSRASLDQGSAAISYSPNFITVDSGSSMLFSLTDLTSMNFWCCSITTNTCTATVYNIYIRIINIRVMSLKQRTLTGKIDGSCGAEGSWNDLGAGL